MISCKLCFTWPLAYSTVFSFISPFQVPWPHILLYSLHSPPYSQILLIFQTAPGIYLYFEASSQKTTWWAYHIFSVACIMLQLHGTSLYTTLYILLFISYLSIGLIQE